MTAMKNPVRGLLEWWLKSEKLEELRAEREQQLSAERRKVAREAESSLLVAWRVLAGIEPIAAADRVAVATPLLTAALARCRELAAPERASFAELFEDDAWRERFTQAGLGDPERQAIRAWLETDPRSEASLDVAKGALLAARTALESVDAPRRAIRMLLLRRAVILAVLVGLIALMAVGVITLLRRGIAPDLAAGKPWKASSAYPGFKVEGEKPARPIEGLFFSTTNENEPWWRVDLGSAVQISAVEIWNRSDCCPERAPPIVLEVSSDDKSWREVARQTDQFSTWKAAVGGPAARYVRVRALHRTLLHLRDVKVYGPPKK